MTADLDPFALPPRETFQFSKADQQLLDDLPWEVQDHFEQQVRRPLTPEVLREEAAAFEDWAVDLRALADRGRR